jgi:hypothetical protein
MAYLEVSYLEKLNLEVGDSISFKPNTSGTYERFGEYRGHSNNSLTFVNGLNGLEEVVPFVRIERDGVRLFYSRIINNSTGKNSIDDHV